MATCKYCGKSGLFFKVSPIGLCGNCEPVITMDIERRAQIISESTGIIVQSSNLDTILSRFDTILKHLEYLRNYEEKGIPTLSKLPSESLKSFTSDDRDNLIVYGLEKEFEKVKGKIQTLKSDVAKVRTLEEFSKQCDSYEFELRDKNKTNRIKITINDMLNIYKPKEILKTGEKGKIGYYKLEEWFYSTFTPSETELMEGRYIDGITLTKNLTKGLVKPTSLTVYDFLRELYGWFWNTSNLGDRIHKKLLTYDFNKFYPTAFFVTDEKIIQYRNAKTIMSEDKVNEEEAELLSWVEKEEAKDKFEMLGVAPHPYERLAVFYRKSKDLNKEYEILLRFTKQRNSGTTSTKLIERLIKVIAMMEKQGISPKES